MALNLRVAHLRQAVPSEHACGDWVGGCSVDHAPHTTWWLAAVDGLGHGPAAAAAADTAQAHLLEAMQQAQWTGRPAALLDWLGPQLADTRGAAIGLACVVQDQLFYAGVGNIRCLRWRAPGDVLRLPSRYGVVGEPRRAGEPGRLDWSSHITLQAGDWLMLFTDGLDENLRLDTIPRLWQNRPQTLCQHLMQHWRDPRDDAAVLVAYLEST